MAQTSELKLTKLRNGELSINVWDAVRECSGLACALRDKCPHLEAKLRRAGEPDDDILLPPGYDLYMDRHGRGFNPAFHEVNEQGVPVIDDEDYLVMLDEIKPSKASLGTCMVERKYMLEQTRPFLKLLKKVPDPFVMQFIGSAILPLYVDLIQFKMKKLTLGEIDYEDAKGIRHMHPVYDEMRKTIKEILNVWKTTGLLQIAKEAGFFVANNADIISPDKNDYELNGNPDLVEALEHAR